VYGNPLERIRKPIRYVVEGDEIIAYDGNDNIAGKIHRSTFKTIYSTPSIRLSSGPDTTFLSLGTYSSLKDAKYILELQEKAQAVPVFEPGRLVGWIDKQGSVSLVKEGEARSRSFLQLLIHFLRKLLNFRKSLP